MESKNEEKTILQLMEILSEKSNDSKLGEEFWAENGAAAALPASFMALLEPARPKPSISWPDRLAAASWP